MGKYDEVAEAFWRHAETDDGPSLDELEAPFLDRLAERVGDAVSDRIAKGIMPDAADDNDEGDDNDDLRNRIIAKAIEDGIVMPAHVVTETGELVSMDEVTSDLLNRVGEAISDRIEKALSPVFDLLGVLAIRQDKMTKAIGVSADAVRNYGRRDVAPRVDRFVSTGTPLSRDGQASADSIASKILDMPYEERRNRLSKAIESGKLDHGRAAAIENFIISAGDRPAGQQDAVLRKGLLEHEIELLTGGVA